MKELSLCGAKKQWQLHKTQKPALGMTFTATVAADEKLGHTA